MRIGRITALLCLLCLAAAPSWAGEIPIIDAHSQLERKVAPERVIELMDAAGVSRTILAARRGTSVKDMKAFAARHPDRITAAVRTKGGAYQDKDLAAFQAFLAKQTKSRQFAAMAEVLIFHHEKRNRKGKVIAPEVAYPPDHEKVRAALAVTLEKGWPFIAHIEFASLGSKRDSYMAGFEAMLDAHPDHPFVLIHMGQLEAGRDRAADRRPRQYFLHYRPQQSDHREKVAGAMDRHVQERATGAAVAGVDRCPSGSLHTRVRQCLGQPLGKAVSPPGRPVAKGTGGPAGRRRPRTGAPQCRAVMATAAVIGRAVPPPPAPPVRRWSPA